MAKNSVFVSPGVYTSENDLSFVTRQVGVTTLGLVGETTKGPAFQPIFVSNYDEFKNFFGGLNASKVKDTGAPAYELPYIAKSYLSQSNQLYVSRILGFSGYDAGLAWGITLDAALDLSTTGVTTTATTYSPLISFTATTAGTITSLVAADPIVQALYDNGVIVSQLAFLGLADTGDTVTIDPVFYKDPSGSNTFSGSSFNLYVDSQGTTGTEFTGTTTGETITYSGTGYSDVENQIVALLRSRAKYDGDENLTFQISATTDLGFDPSITTAEEAPLGDFTLTGNSNTQGLVSYSLSLDKTKKNYLNRVLGTEPKDNETAIFVEEFFLDMFEDLNTLGKVRGINQTLVEFGSEFDDYKAEFSPAITPWIVSELRGTNLLRLFRFHTISDGNSANKEFKISISNIKPDDREFDVSIRVYSDTDAKPVVLERFARCSMDPSSNNYIAKKIGTFDGNFPARSNYVLIELETESDTSDAFPAGFVGVPVRDYTVNGNTSVIGPDLEYKTSYGVFENKRKIYLGLSDTVGIDQDFFDYKGVPNSTTINQWTGLTQGFHMDIDATGATIDNVEIVIDSTGGTYSPVFLFDTGNAEFRTDAGIEGTDYEKIYARKFTFAPYGGYDGWDVYRTRRTNKDNYLINGSKGAAGLLNGTFSNRALTNGDTGINSDYYAYLEAIWTFRNPESTNINVFATPGIDVFDNSNLVEESIEMIEQDRADSIYIVTTPDTDSAGDILLAENVVSDLDDQFDSNYTATYWPWIQINDAENNQYIWVPPTRDVVRNIALTDNIAFPWFAVAGIQRGDVDAVQARVKLTQVMRDELYAGRINPVTTWTTDGIKIWGNKTLQVKESALDRINVRRLLLQARKLISAVAIRLLFEQNDAIVRNQFLGLVNPILDNIRSERGLTDFRVVLDNDPESIDRNELCGRIFIKPTRALEFICVEFNIMDTGASFDDI
jgi:hypothetical protein